MLSEKIKRSRFFKSISVCLMVVFSFYNLSYSSIPDHPDMQVGISEGPQALNVQDIAVALNVGRVKSRFEGHNGKTIIHIQDAHCHYEAQQNINNILEQVTREWGVDMISVEGAEGIVDTSWFRAFPDAEIRKEVADYFMRKGEITGAEFFSITSDYDGIIFGAETRDYYIDNLNAFTDVYPYRDTVEDYFKDLSAVASRLKSIIYTPNLRHFDRQATAFDNNDVELSDYAAFLKESAENVGVEFSSFENFARLQKTLYFEEKIDFDVVDRERREYIDLLNQMIDSEEMTNLVTYSVRFKKGHIKPIDFYSYLRELARVHNIEIVREYPNLFHYYLYTKLYDGINVESLFNEIFDLEQKIKAAMFTSEDQKQLDAYADMVNLHIKLINIELTNKHYDRFESYREEVGLNQLLSFFSRMVARYNLRYNIGALPELVERSVPRLIDFYEIAIARDKALVDNTLRKMREEGKDRSVLIAGGFHTRGMKMLLERKGVSYVVATPNITKNIETPYIKVLTNQRTSVEDILTESAAAPGTQQGVSAGSLGSSPLDFLSPLLRFSYGITMYLDPEQRQALAELSDAMGKVDSVDGLHLTYEGQVATTFNEAISMLTERWLETLEAELVNVMGQEAAQAQWSRFIEDTSLWNMLKRNCVHKYEEYFASIGRTAPEAVKEAIRKEFDLFREDRQERETRSPGTEHAAPLFERSLTEAEKSIIDDAIGDTLRHMRTRQGIKSVPHQGTGGNFVVLDDEIYERNLRQRFDEAVADNRVEATSYAILRDVRTHPGTAGTRAEYERDGDFSKVTRNYYIRESDYSRLKPSERDILAQHELMHIKLALGIVQQRTPGSEESFVNKQTGHDVRPIMARLNSISHMESLLLNDVNYGDAARTYINEERQRINKLRGPPAEEAEENLREWIRKAYARRVNIDRMRNVLTSDDYAGYDVIIVSSTSQEEADYQRDVLERAFAGTQTDNDLLGNHVCILSVYNDLTEGGQLPGHLNTWIKAREEFSKWARERGLPETSLDSLSDEEKIKVAVYHNSGLGSRSSPVPQSLGSRGVQKLVGQVTNRRGESFDLELVLAVVLETSALASSNDGSRKDGFWVNQVAFGTTDFSNLERSNYHFDKFSIEVPADPRKKDLFDYGTAKIASDGKIEKFLPNKTIAKQNATTGEFEVVEHALYGELMDAVNAKDRAGVFDYGSFSMSNQMHNALLEYWVYTRGIIDQIRRDVDTVSRDVDPAMVAVLVPIVNALMDRNITEEAPKLIDLSMDLSVTAPEFSQRESLLSVAYKDVLEIMKKTDPGKEFAETLEAYYHARPDNRRYVLEAIDFMLFDLAREGGIFFAEPYSGVVSGRVVGHIDMGAESHWWPYKRLLDMGNEKFVMLNDLLVSADPEKKVTRQELGPDGEFMVNPPITHDTRLEAEDARRMRGISSDRVAEFIVDGRKVTLSADQVRRGWRDVENDIEIRGSVISGETILLPGSRIIDSVVNDSQGQIIAESSYIETTTAPRISAERSIIVKAVGLAAGEDVLKADREIVADAFRRWIELDERDDRFADHHTRMRAPIGYDPKGEVRNDKVRFDDNRFAFQVLRERPGDRFDNEAIERELRSRELFGILDRQSHLGIFGELKFGTSGLRDTVENLTDMEVYINTRGFIKFLKDIGQIDRHHRRIAVAGDLRSSTPRIVRAVSQAVRDEGLEILYVGKAPSPTVMHFALYGPEEPMPSIMVTGSHIPDDRNGIKFAKSTGEVLKADESAILSGVAEARREEYGKTWQETLFDQRGYFKETVDAPMPEAVHADQAREGYVRRYTDFFPDQPLKGQIIAYYQHSGVGRDVITEIFEKLGATVVPAGRSEVFIPVDTEKVSAQTRQYLRELADGVEREYGVKPLAVITTDGDSDRPLIADETGTVLPGDKLGALVSKFLQPSFAAVPISSNDAVVQALEDKGIGVQLTQIGSPHVIAAMNRELKRYSQARVVGWEANGGFLTGSDWEKDGRVLKALPTRDAVLPLLTTMLLALQEGKSVSEIIADLPSRYTSSDVVDNTTSGLEEYTPEMGKSIIASFSPSQSGITQVDYDERGEVRDVHGVEQPSDEIKRELVDIRERLGVYFSGDLGFAPITSVNFIDGTQVRFADNVVYHIRPSGNAPEFRNYITADSQEAADRILALRETVIPAMVAGISPASAETRSPGTQAMRSEGTAPVVEVFSMPVEQKGVFDQTRDIAERIVSVSVREDDQGRVSVVDKIEVFGETRFPEIVGQMATVRSSEREDGRVRINVVEGELDLQRSGVSVEPLEQGVFLVDVTHPDDYEELSLISLGDQKAVVEVTHAGSELYVDTPFAGVADNLSAISEHKYGFITVESMYPSAESVREEENFLNSLLNDRDGFQIMTFSDPRRTGHYLSDAKEQIRNHLRRCRIEGLGRIPLLQLTNELFEQLAQEGFIQEMKEEGVQIVPPVDGRSMREYVAEGYFLAREMESVAIIQGRLSVETEELRGDDSLVQAYQRVLSVYTGQDVRLSDISSLMDLEGLPDVSDRDLTNWIRNFLDRFVLKPIMPLVPELMQRLRERQQLLWSA